MICPCADQEWKTYAEELGIDYDELFSNYDFIIQKLAKHTIRISEMGEIEYKDMLNKLETKTKINRDKCLEIIEKNTILDNIIDDYTLNFI